MSKSPWMKFYAADYLLDPDVDALPLEAQAILIRMWSVVWIEGSIPSAAEEIARKCRISVLHVQMHLQKLMHFFCTDADGLLRSERMDKEREHSRQVSEKRSYAATVKHSKGLAAHAHADAHANGHAVRSQMSDTDKNKGCREFNSIELARAITLEIHVAGSPTLLRTIADSIEAWTGQTGNPPMAAVKFLTAQAKDFLKIQNKAFGLQTFFAEAKYNDPAETWEKRSNGTSKARNRSEEALEAIRGTDDADFDAMAARQAQSQSLPRRT